MSDETHYTAGEVARAAIELQGLTLELLGHMAIDTTGCDNAHIAERCRRLADQSEWRPASDILMTIADRFDQPEPPDRPFLHLVKTDVSE